MASFPLGGRLKMENKQMVNRAARKEKTCCAGDVEVGFIRTHDGKIFYIPPPGDDIFRVFTEGCCYDPTPASMTDHTLVDVILATELGITDIRPMQGSVT